MTLTWVGITLACLLGCVICFSIGGNVLVCLAVVTDRHLRKVGNSFIVSLATADLLVSSVVMPLAAANDLLGYWPWSGVTDSLGRHTLPGCHMWMSLDVMCCTASILSLCAISMDKYIYIRTPLNYHIKITGWRVAFACGAIWLCSAIISFIPINLGWHQSPDVTATSPHVSNTSLFVSNTSLSNTSQLDVSVADGGNTSVPVQCTLALNPTYAIVSSMISFYLPCLIVVAIYVKLYRYARAQMKAIQRLQVNHEHLNMMPVPSATNSGRNSVDGAQSSTSASTRHQHKYKHRRDHKAAVTVGVIVGVFLCCWVPFFIINIISSICSDCVPPLWFHILTWLGYMNSSLNPVIYSIFNKEFRRAFHRLLVPHQCLRAVISKRGWSSTNRQYSQANTTINGNLPNVTIKVFDADE